MTETTTSSGLRKASDAVHTCPKCAKTFSRAVNRDRHLATHNTVPSLACSICQRRFHRPDVLAKHVQRHRDPSASQHRVEEGSSKAPFLAASVRLETPEQHMARSHKTNNPHDPSPSSRSLAASRRVAQACSRCSKAKARCDGQLPACGRCIRLDKASMCEYDASMRDSALSDPVQAGSSMTISQPPPSPPHTALASSNAQFGLAPPVCAQQPHYHSHLPTASSIDPSCSTNARNLVSAASNTIASGALDGAHHVRPNEATDLESWRQSQMHLADTTTWDTTVSPLPMNWLLSSDIPVEGWSAYLGDPGVPLLADFFDYADPSASAMRADSHSDTAQALHHHAFSFSNAVGESSSSRPQPQRSAQTTSTALPSQTSPNRPTSRAFLRTSTSQPASNATSPATMDAADAAATLARIRSEAVNNGFMRSATPSDEGSSGSGSRSPRPATTAPRSYPNRHPAKRARRLEAGESLDRAAQSTRALSPDSSSESSDLDPMERANRDVAAQSRRQRVSYRHPDPSARAHFSSAVAAQSPEDIARQEAAAEDMAQQEQFHSPHAASDRSSKRRRRRQMQWPSVYRPKATDGGRHLSLHKVPLASAEVTALENSFQVAPMTDLAKERMIDEFRYCEVEAQDLRRIQDTLRSIKTSTLNLFVQLYFEHHDPVLPILHRATFDPDTCDPLLLAAVTCLGALCSKAENAFSYCLLTSSLVHAVSYKLFGINHLRNRYLPSMQTLFLTYALWRNLGDPAKLEYVEGFRNIILTMARRCRLFELDAFEVDRSSVTASPSLSTQASMPDPREQEWHRWIRHQEMVRFNWGLLVLDSDLSLAWDLPCTITIGELRSPLPCQESMWLAESADEWLGLAHDHLAGSSKYMLRHLLSKSGQSFETESISAFCPSALDTKVLQHHASPLTCLVLSAAVYNVTVSRSNLDTVLVDFVELHDAAEDDDELIVGLESMPRKDAAFDAWTSAMTSKLQILTAKASDSSGKGDAQLMLYGGKLRALVSFKAVQIMSGRKGHRRSKLQMRKWLQGPLRQEQYRNDLFETASKIFALSLAARRDIAPIYHEDFQRMAPTSGLRDRSNSRSSSSAMPGDRIGADSGLSNLAHASLSGTGAENSVLFYATVCLVLLCQYLSQEHSTSQASQASAQHQSAELDATSANKPSLERAASVSRNTRKKDVYFLQGVGALTNSVSLDRLIHVAVHQGFNRSAWPLSSVLGKVLQQWARTLPRS